MAVIPALFAPTLVSFFSPRQLCKDEASFLTRILQGALID